MIFNIFKSKPTLRELIPDGFVDIHSHILPGIDDGAKNIKESISLISEMNKLGFSKIIGTPHTYHGLYENTNKSIQESFNIIKNKANEFVKLSYSSEYLIDNDLLKKAQEKTILCLKDNYVLIEMSYISKPKNLYEIIFELIHNNYRPILAHPERYRFLFDRFDEFMKLKKVGCLFQVNLFSLTGHYGSDVLGMANKLISKDMVNFTGSDIHRPRQIKIFENRVHINDIKKLEIVMNNNRAYFD